MSSSSFIGRPLFYILILLLVIAFGVLLGLVFYNVSNPYIRGNGEVDATKVQNIDISWQQGDVWIQTGDTDTITLSETGAVQSDHKVIFRAHEGVLTVKYCMPKILHPTSGELPKKNLVITVPADKTDMLKISIYGTNATFQIEDFHLQNLMVEQGTAKCKVSFNGSAEQLDFHAIDTSFNGTFHNRPELFNISSSTKTVSTYLDFTIPADVGFIYDAGYFINSAQPMKTIFDETVTPYRPMQYYYGDQSLKINIARNSQFTQMNIHIGPPLGE